MCNIALLLLASSFLVSAVLADSYQEAYADSRVPGDNQSAKLSDRSPTATATASGSISPGVVYGAPLISHPNPAPVYGSPIRQQQYVPPAQINAGVQYGAPFPVYGAPASISNPPPGPIFTPDHGIPFNFDILGLLSSIPLPDIHSVLKILFKITVFKAIIKVISLFMLLIFAPKLEDIFSMIGMMTGVTGDDDHTQNSDAVPSTMNDNADDDEQDTVDIPTKKPTISRLRAAKEMKLDQMASRLHESINKTAQELAAACRGKSCSFGLDSQTDMKSLTATGLITRMLESLTGMTESKKKPIAKNLKKPIKSVAVS